MYDVYYHDTLGHLKRLIKLVSIRDHISKCHYEVIVGTKKKILGFLLAFAAPFSGLW